MNLKQKLVGQGYDGCSAMSGEIQGCAARITEEFPQAIYVHCISHSLNLAVSDTCKIPAVRNSIATINEIIKFFRNSPKRTTVLNKAVDEVNDENKRKKLIKYCETRWLERLDSIVIFQELSVPIYHALGEIQETFDSKTTKNAFVFEKTMKDASFMIGMVVIREIFALTHPLSVALQSKSIDLAAAVDLDLD